MAGTLEKQSPDTNDWEEKVSSFCHAQTISSVYATKTDQSPGEISKTLFGESIWHGNPSKSPPHRDPASPRDLEWARSCGKFDGTNPSELFLRAYRDVLRCLVDDPSADCCSPALTGSIGFVPLTVIASIHDQLRHMSNLIANAKKEVLLATNYWKGSKASQLLSDAIVELNRRAGERGERVTCLVMYDRGNAHQIYQPHQNVVPATYTGENVALPGPDVIPNIDFQVVNFHHPPLGTFHSKFMVVDRQIACVSSNNVQDNDNTEMLAQYEGPIVDSIWETFLFAWHNKINPPLPCRDITAASAPAPSYQVESFRQLFTSDGLFRKPEEPMHEDLPEHMPGDPHYDDSIAAEIQRMRSTLKPRNGESEVDVIARHLNKPTGIGSDFKATAPDRNPDLHYFPFIPVSQSAPVPMAMVSRKPYAPLNTKSEFVPQNEAFSSLIRNAKRSIFIQTPDLNARPLLPILADACKRGVDVTYYVCLGYNDGGELLPGQGGTNEMAANALFKMVDGPEREHLKIFNYVAADQDHPIHNSFKQRSCHIKLLIVDEQCAVQGSGNQDTQSWFHSQEVNVMLDSPEICRQWREGIERNQNTALYGRVRDDGCWYDSNGTLAAGSSGTDPGRFGWAKGMIGTLKKAAGA